MIDRSTPAVEGLAIARYPGPFISEHLPLVGRYHLEKFAAPIEWYAGKIAQHRGTLADEAAVGRMRSFADLPPWLQLAADAAMRHDLAPYEESDWTNGFLNAGITALLTILIGSASAANTSGAAAGVDAVFNNAQTRMGIGDSTTAFAATQTDLQAATNKWYQVMDATYPSVSAQTISYRITVAGANANYAWQEFVVDNCGGSNSTSTTRSGGTTLSRAVSSQGTKASGQTWVPTYNFTPGN